MKRLLSFFYALSVLLSVSSCDNLTLPGVIVDWAPVEIIIKAYDSAGNSIISEDMPGMSLVFNGEEYTVLPWDYQPKVETKAYMPHMFGLRAKPETDGQGTVSSYILIFGEIDGAADMDEDIILNWPDGSRDTIHYHCSNHREWPTVNCTRKWKLNGKKHDGSTFVFKGKSI